MIGHDLWRADSWVVQFLPHVLGAVGVLLVAMLGARAAGAAITRLGTRRHLEPDLVNLLARATRLTVVMFGIVTAIGTLGVDVKALVAGLGLTGFALGFALKDIISNTLAGVLILLYKPFHRGDRIEVSGNDGHVESIDMRYTILITADGSRVLVPNASLFTNSIRVFAASAPAPTDLGTV